MDMEYVYYVVNVNENHWFMCQICLISLVIIIYDLDIVCTAQENFEKLIEPIANMLPYFLLQAEF